VEDRIAGAFLLQTLEGNWKIPTEPVRVLPELYELAEFLFHKPDVEGASRFLHALDGLTNARQERVIWRFYVWILDGDLHPLGERNKEAKILAGMYLSLLQGGQVSSMQLRKQQDKVMRATAAGAGAWAGAWVGACAWAWAAAGAWAEEYLNLRTLAASRLIQFAIQEQEETKSK